MRDDAHLLHVDLVTLVQTVVRSVGHGDDGIGQVDDALENLALVPGGTAQHRVQHDDGGNGQGAEQGENLVAVRAAEHAVFVLDDDHVGVGEQVCRPVRAAGVTGDQLADDLGTRSGLGRVDQADDAADPTRSGDQLAVEGRAEGGQPTLRGRVRADETEPRGHAQGLSLEGSTGSIRGRALLACVCVACVPSVGVRADARLGSGVYQRMLAVVR